MALTVALGTVGAIGTAVYVTRADSDAAVAAAEADPEADVEEDLPEADPDPVPAAPAPAQVAPTPPPIADTVVPDDGEDLSQVPAPYTEGAWMNS